MEVALDRFRVTLPKEIKAVFIPQPLEVLVVTDPDTCPCGKPAEYGIHGMMRGKVKSFYRCATHKHSDLEGTA